jgi:tRNA-splicing ligase RtcB
MIAAELIQQIDAYRFLVPKGARPGMRTDAMIYADSALLAHILKDLSLEQAANVAALPGIVGRALAMPDIHQGYGFPIGGVAATAWHDGVVSPGGVGFDINCGVRLLSTSLTENEVRPRLRDLVLQLFRDVPCGTGGEGCLRITSQQLLQLLVEGSKWMVENGYGEGMDAELTESGGRLPGAKPDKLSPRALQRGRPQVGSLGSGNHFLEVQYVEQVFHQEAAEAMGLETGRVVVLIHSGSRGLGHQVCTDYVKLMGAAMQKYGISLPDRQLACVPIQSPEGQDYLAAMAAAANFAWANRQGMAHYVRRAFQRLFGGQTHVRMVYDVAHNIAKRELHQVPGETGTRDVLVHRKGATRAFPAGHLEIPARYRHVGQPVLIPGSMGTASWVLVGTEGAMRESFGSVCHGAGRMLSRTAARKGHNAKDVQRELEERGIIVKSETRDGILEEIPEAYKDVDHVIEVVHNAGLARKVARLRPMGVIKG